MWKPAVVLFCCTQLCQAVQTRQPGGKKWQKVAWPPTSQNGGWKPNWHKPTDSGAQNGTLHGSYRKDKGPSLYVAVLSKRAAFGKRANLREMWQDGAIGWREKGWGELKYKFVIGTHSGNENLEVHEKLDAESKRFGDMVMEDSPEGYLDGLLTTKVYLSMKTYLKTPHTPDLFMKIDDDTFVEFQRLRGVLRKYISNGGDITKAYMGVYMRNNKTLEPHRGEPCRDPKSIWFENPEKFDGSYYPVAPQGGPGYILHQSVVRKIVNWGIASSNLLNMEDKATGVWVDELMKQSHGAIKMEYVDVPGTNGYALLDRWIRGPMYQYPFALHHHLDGMTIACLHRVAKQTDLYHDLTAKVDKCNFIKAKSPGDDAVCNDGRKGQPHDASIEGWDFMKWEVDEYGDQVPIAGSTRIFSTKKRADPGHHFDDAKLSRAKGVTVVPIV